MEEWLRNVSFDTALSNIMFHISRIDCFHSRIQSFEKQIIIMMLGPGQSIAS
jgi:hypothetical protein